MNTLHFRYAIEVERTGSISQAAENLFMAQPNLSKSIKELEDSLGISIFERTSKGMIPTEQGMEFLKYAKQIMQQIENMKSISLSKQERERQQSLRISIPRVSYISYGLTNLINELDMKKKIDLHILETNSMSTIYNVFDNNSDFGIIRYQLMYENYFLDYLKERNLSYQEIWEFESLVLMSSEHKLAKEDIIDYHTLSQSSIEIIHEDNIIPYCPTTKMRQNSIDEERKDIHKQIYVCERGSQFDLLSSVPTTYMRVSPMPTELCERNNLVQRKCEINNNKFRDLLIFHKAYSFKDIDQKCVRKILEARDKVSSKEYD